MPWHFREPSTFPATFPNAVRTAAACRDEAVILGSASTHSDALGLAERFRHFKWCVGQSEDYVSLQRLFDKYDYRSKIVSDEIGYIVFVTARSTKLSEFVRLNPQLAHSIAVDRL